MGEQAEPINWLAIGGCLILALAVSVGMAYVELLVKRNFANDEKDGTP
jgi:hypothetical protein